MVARLRTRWHDALRRRELAGAARAGRYARGLAWKAQLAFVRQWWWVLLLVALVVVAGSVPLALTLGGSRGWFVVGLAVGTAFWTQAFLVSFASGAVGALAGLMGETWTADELRGLRRRGWHVVNGIKLRVGDIDHLAVGPGGVLVVETKYSEDAWPLGKSGPGYMNDSLSRAVAQARRNALDVARFENFKLVIADAPVRGVLVVWSAAPRADQSPDWVDEAGVTVVHGRALRRWLGTVHSGALSAERIEQVWAAFSAQAAVRDRNDAERTGPARPTLSQLGSRVLLQLPLGAFAAGNVVVALGAVPEWGFPIGLVTALGIGLVARRSRRVRWAAWSWTTVILLALVAWLLLSLATLLR